MGSHLYLVLAQGRVVFKDVVEKYYKDTNKEFGTDFKAPK